MRFQQFAKIMKASKSYRVLAALAFVAVLPVTGLAALDTNRIVQAIRLANANPVRVFGSAFAPEKNAITVAPLEATLHQKAQTKDGMAKFVIGRETKMPCGCAMTKEMGVNTCSRNWASK